MTVTDEPVVDVEPDGVDGESRVSRGFVAWGVGTYVVVTAVLVVASLATSDGHLVYLIDDPAIHLSIAQTFAESGTWGVVPGEFQSASSAPLWTLALAVVSFVVPAAATVAPLVFNVAAAIGLIVVLGRTQAVLVPGRRRILDGPAVAVIVVAVLFLPALTMLGMEHVAHMLLAVTAVALWTGALPGSTRHRLLSPTALTIALVAVGTLVRFETMFLALGLALAALSPSPEATTARPTVDQIRRAVLVVVAAVVPFAAFAAVNLAMGQSFLPNSVLAKGQVVSGEAESSISLLAIAERLTQDPVVAAFALAALLAVVLGWRRHRFTSACITVVVTVALHVTVADIGWFDRYQAYLIALGVFAMLQVGSELGASRDGSRRVSRASLCALCALLLVAPKVSLTTKVTDGVADTYLQRFQAGRFLDRYYDGRSIATGELGYISLTHDGPVMDLFGLADYEVLELRRSNDQRVPAAEWARVAEERGVEVVAMYPLTLWTESPPEWIHVGDWVLREPVVTAFQAQFQFWATSPEQVVELRDHLVEFESELPDGVDLTIDEFADLRAAELAGS